MLHRDPDKTIERRQSSRIIWMAFLNSMYKKEFLQHVSIDSGAYKKGNQTHVELYL